MKDELGFKDGELDKEKANAESTIRRVVRKAERAIKFFKDAAFQRGAITAGGKKMALKKSVDGKENEEPERLITRHGEFNLKSAKSRPSRFNQ